MRISKKLIIKARLSKIFGLTKFCYFLNRNKKRIIGYHNIIPDRYFDESIHLECSHRESVFKNQLKIINSRFKVNLEIKEEGTATLTFDDGYFNQYSIASKIMDGMNNQGYFFCAVNLIDDKKILEIDKLMYWMSYVPFGEYNLDEINYKLVIKEQWQRNEQWSILYEMINKSFTFEDLSRILDKAYAFKNIKIDDEFYNLRFKGITREDLNEMKKKNHKIGAHSVTHSIFSRMKTEDLEEEIKCCSRLLGDVYNTKLFAYPYGGKSDIPTEAEKMLSRNGFSSALAYGNSDVEGGYSEYYIPRIILPDTDDADVIDFILSGAINMISYKKLLPDWINKEGVNYGKNNSYSTGI